jgi:hypothetical protein
LDAPTKPIDWTRIEARLVDISSSAKGEPAWPPLALFKALLLSVWYDLSDVKRVEALDERASLRRFRGFSGNEATPKRTASRALPTGARRSTPARARRRKWSGLSLCAGWTPWAGGSPWLRRAVARAAGRFSLLERLSEAREIIAGQKALPRILPVAPHAPARI